MALIIIAACNAFAIEETIEPTLKYVISINGKEYDLELEKELIINGMFNNPKVILKANTTRHFTYGGIEFIYPAYFTWEAEIEGERDKNWTLSGNDAKIMYFVLPKKVTLDAFVESIVTEFGENPCKIKGITHKFQGKTYTGKQIAVTIGSVHLIIDTLLIPSSENFRFLLLQDSLGDDKKSSEEYASILQLLNQSLFVK
ncbi:MAG: hypothetical protein GY801_01600 [bacterium]|nr:hypothetical protein [bacterium]